MLFNSYVFAVFLAALLGAYYGLPLPWRARKLLLICAGYLFYASWNPPFLLLLWFTTLLDWCVGKALGRSQSEPGRKRLLVLSVAVNLGLLAIFKYGDFILANAATLSGWLGAPVHPDPLAIVLPVGISFYTFQSLAYAIDVYRRRIEPARSFVDYALFVAFIPPLIAGPIVRADAFLPQAAAAKRFDASRVGWGLALVVLGLFQKVVLADGVLAPIVDLVFRGSGAVGAADAWAGAVAFAAQIFLDFAGYSTCAIGVAQLLGFHIADNFRFPYASVGFSDFWRRWHISLSTWLRDYLYIPLGGDRRGKLRTYSNLMLTMLLGGLWHGASWTFVVWGALHGLYLGGERLLRARWGAAAVWRRPLARAALGLLTFALVCVAWVFFRAHTLDRAGSLVLAMFGAAEADTHARVSPARLAQALVVCGLLVGVHVAMRRRSLEELVAQTPWWLRGLLLALMLTLLTAVTGGRRAFIYFQF